MRILIVLSLVVFNTCTALSQSNSAQVVIDRFSIYNDFQQRGYTTAGAFTHFDDLKNGSFKQIIVDAEHRKRLEGIMNQAKQNKHNQTKLGGELIFGEEMVLGSDGTSNKIIVTGVGTAYNIFGRSKGERAFIVDLSQNIDYKITIPGDLKWIRQFRERFSGSK